MFLTKEVRDSHSDLGATSLDFLAFAQETPKSLERSSFGELEEANELRQYKLQSWPTFVGSEKVAEFERVNTGLFRIIKSIPEKIFDNDPQKISNFYGFSSPIVAALILEEPTGMESALARGDFILASTGLKCLEYNVGASLGGLQVKVWADMYMASSLVRQFLDSRNLEMKFTDTSRILLEHILDEAEKRLSLNGTVNVGILVDKKFSPPIVKAVTEYTNAVYRSVLADRARPLCGRIVLGTADSLADRQGRACLGGVEVHSVIELAEAETNGTLYRHFKAGKLNLFNGPISHVLGSKANLALISERQESDVFDREERELIRNHVPWTRIVKAGETSYRGEREDLPALLAARRPELVLKPFRSNQGKGVYIGQVTPEPEWRDIVGRAVREGTWIVQECLESRPYLYQDLDEGCSVHDLVWGFFAFGERYGGGFLRMLPKRQHGIVNAARGATEGVIFETAPRARLRAA